MSNGAVREQVRQKRVHHPRFALLRIEDARAAMRRDSRKFKEVSP
jgi:hypothetical protein